MKAMKHLLAAAFVFGSVFAGSAIAAEKRLSRYNLNNRRCKTVSVIK